MVAAGTNQPPEVPRNPAANGTAQPAQDSRLQHVGLSSHDATLFASLRTNNFDLEKTATDHGLDITQLAAWFATPPIQHAAAALLAASRTLLELKLDRARTAAIDTLQSIALQHESLIERRRAASALLRGLGPAGRFSTCQVKAAPSHALEPDPQRPLHHHPRQPDPRNPSRNPPTPAPPRHHLDTIIDPPANPGIHHITAGAHASRIGPPPPLRDDAPGDPPRQLLSQLWSDFSRGDLARLSTTVYHFSTVQATIDGRPLRQALPSHPLSQMVGARGISYVEESRSHDRAAYTFSFEGAPRSPARRSFRFHFIRPDRSPWLLRQIETLDTS